MPSESIFSQLRAWWAQLDAQQRFSFSVFAPCAGVVLILSVWLLRFTVMRPFRVSLEAAQQAQQLLTPSSTQPTVVNGKSDLDRDGLSDADEVNLYHTSPYLSDTDSDGTSDGQEVQRNTDPNCPQGKECFAGGVANGDAVGDQAPVGDQNPTAKQPITLSTPPPPAQMTPDQIRLYLVANQLMSEADARSLPDEGVIQLYGRVYDQLAGIHQTQSSPTVTASSTASAAVSSTVESPRSSPSAP